MVTVCAGDIKGNIKLSRSDTSNYEALAAGSRVLSNILCFSPVAVYWCEPTHFNFGVVSALSTSCEIFFSVYKYSKGLV